MSALVAAPLPAAATDIWRHGTSEVYTNAPPNGGTQVDFTDQAPLSPCWSTGSPGDTFTFLDDILLDNTLSESDAAFDFSFQVFEWVSGARGSELYAETETLSALAGEAVTGSNGGASIEYTGWNGATSCGGTFEVYRVVAFTDGSGYSVSRSVVY